jgi:hypothetical protein
MRAKKFVIVSMFLVLMGLVGGCHSGSHDDDRAWGYGRSSVTPREAFQAGRAYERRRAWNNDRYSYSPWDRYGYYRR